MMERQAIRHRLIHARGLLPVFYGWDQSEEQKAEDARQEEIRQREFRKDEKKRLIKEGIISRF